MVSSQARCLRQPHTINRGQDSEWSSGETQPNHLRGSWHHSLMDWREEKTIRLVGFHQKQSSYLHFKGIHEPSSQADWQEDTSCIRICSPRTVYDATDTDEREDFVTLPDVVTCCINPSDGRRQVAPRVVVNNRRFTRKEEAPAPDHTVRLGSYEPRRQANRRREATSSDIFSATATSSTSSSSSSRVQSFHHASVHPASDSATNERYRSDGSNPVQQLARQNVASIVEG